MARFRAFQQVFVHRVSCVTNSVKNDELAMSSEAGGT